MMTALIGLRGYIKGKLIRLSILLNLLLGGQRNQTFSARNHQRQRENKLNLTRLIDFMLGEGHCLECWVKWKLRVKR